MIGISRLLLGTIEGGDRLRFGHAARPAGERRPIVVWNCTTSCNLDCRHCYADDGRGPVAGLSTAQAEAMIADLSAFGIPVLLFSGGEPLLRPDLFALMERARSAGLKTVVSTNGTLITPEVARRLGGAGVSYVGISLDGAPARHDAFRGQPGAFAASLAGLRACRAAGVRTGLRLTLTRDTSEDLDVLFDLIRDERIPRACFYHLVPSGRGRQEASQDLDRAGARAIVGRIIERTRDLHAGGHPAEILTVDNHSDGAFLWLRLRAAGDPRADAVRDLLATAGGNASGQGIACIAADGTVFPDQFWRWRPLGSVVQRPFSQIWSGDDPLLVRLREKPRRISGRCGGCRFFAWCNGNFRARAEAATGDPWASDPGCILTDDEIAGAVP